MTARKSPAPASDETAPAIVLPSAGGSYVLVDGIPTPETPPLAQDAPVSDPEA